jgi:hypothetical protein
MLRHIPILFISLTRETPIPEPQLPHVVEHASRRPVNKAPCGAIISSEHQQRVNQGGTKVRASRGESLVKQSSVGELGFPFEGRGGEEHRAAQISSCRILGTFFNFNNLPLQGDRVHEEHVVDIGVHIASQRRETDVSTEPDQPPSGERQVHPHHGGGAKGDVEVDREECGPSIGEEVISIEIAQDVVPTPSPPEEEDRLLVDDHVAGVPRGGEVLRWIHGSEASPGVLAIARLSDVLNLPRDELPDLPIDRHVFDQQRPVGEGSPSEIL